MSVNWRTKHGSFPLQRAALGACNLSVVRIGEEWRWLVRREGRDLAEGVAPTAPEAREAAETAATTTKITLASGMKIPAHWVVMNPEPGQVLTFVGARRPPPKEGAP